MRVPALAALLANILFAFAVHAQEVPPERDDRTTILFRIGMTALAASERADSDEARRELYDKAIAAFRLILVNRPELIRVRLELARTFFLKGQDGLARRHFELVLAGGVPPVVAANIRRFMNAMQTRKRFTGYFGAAVAPDSNLNAASESEIIYIDTAFGRLPFQRQGDFGARSGLGVSVWGGGEYQHPLSQRLRLRVGADAGAAGIQRQRLRSTLRGRPHRAALAGRARSPSSACWLPCSGNGSAASRTWTRPACVWNSTAG